MMPQEVKSEWIEMLQDWAQQARYLAANKSLSPIQRKRAAIEARVFGEVIRYLNSVSAVSTSE